MKNGYVLLKTLTDTLNKNYSLISEMLTVNKEQFSNNDDYINIAVGILNEVKDITCNLDIEMFLLNRKLYDLLSPIVNYANNLFDSYKLVNTYKLYDSLKINLCDLRNFLNSFSIE